MASKKSLQEGYRRLKKALSNFIKQGGREEKLQLVLQPIRRLKN